MFFALTCVTLPVNNTVSFSFCLLAFRACPENLVTSWLEQKSFFFSSGGRFRVMVNVRGTSPILASLRLCAWVYVFHTFRTSTFETMLSENTFSKRIFFYRFIFWNYIQWCLLSRSVILFLKAHFVNSSSYFFYNFIIHCRAS